VAGGESDSSAAGPADPPGTALRRGFRGFWGSLCADPVRFLLGRPTRRLYDLHADPDERVDRLDERPEVVAELVQRLAGLEAQAGSDEPAPSLARLQAEDEQKIVDHLRRLGYLD